MIEPFNMKGGGRGPYPQAAPAARGSGEGSDDCCEIFLKDDDTNEYRKKRNIQRESRRKPETARKKRARKQERQRSTNRVRMLAKVARSRARVAGMEFDSSFTDGMPKNPKRCACCGAEFDYIGLFDRVRSPSLDRIDNARGYVKGNVAVICYGCNSKKRDMTLDELKRMVRYIENGQRP